MLQAVITLTYSFGFLCYLSHPSKAKHIFKSDKLCILLFTFKT
uniref:Uncharacterized protein n=1 Tax=Anguilla anguilla TaxID=7936 RepID=A0A0E9RYN6_ANGAN